MVCRCTLCTFPFYESLFIWDNSALAVLHSELELERRKMHRSNCLKWKNSWRRTNRAFVTSRWHQDEGELTYHIFKWVQCFPSRDWMIESLWFSISIMVFNDRLGRQGQFLAASWKLCHQGNCNSRGQRRRACDSLQCTKSASCFECQAYIPTTRCLSPVQYGIRYTTIATNLGQIQATYVHMYTGKPGRFPLCAVLWLFGKDAFLVLVFFLRLFFSRCARVEWIYITISPRFKAMLT